MSRSLILFLFLGLVACGEDDNMPPPEAVPAFVMSGGETTIFDATSNAYATPAPNLSASNFDKHLAGDLAFEQIFVTEPAAINPGLGPLFNNNSCVSCHVRNGRSTAADNGDDISGFLLRISVPGTSVHGGPKAVPYFGTQLQTRAIHQVEKEASFTTEEINEIVNFADGAAATLSKLNYHIEDSYQPLPDDMMVSPRVAPAVFGLGLLEAIPESTIAALADENDADNDGISGKMNRVWNEQTGTHELGRFGWKAEMPTALLQTAEAYHQDMGITSSIMPKESCSDQTNCGGDGNIDISDTSLEETTFYIQTLAVPAVRNYDDVRFQQGQALFESAQCATCHTPKQVTGPAFIDELSHQEIYPYTDMLLHDMGDGLSDNRPSFEATGNEWRTPPLWGIGLIPVVNGHSQLMHDGRARNVEEAILWHGGEGAASMEAYKTMSAAEREALIFFVESL